MQISEFWGKVLYFGGGPGAFFHNTAHRLTHRTTTAMLGRSESEIALVVLPSFPPSFPSRTTTRLFSSSSSASSLQGCPMEINGKTLLSRNALSGNFDHHSSALICKFHHYCNQPPRPTNVNNVTSHECKWDEWGGHCAAGHPWGPVRPQSHSRSQSSLSFVPQLSPANLCRHNTPCFCFRISRAGNYTLGHSLSRYVLFCSLLEGPVTNWAAQ